ncbi:MAG TPA: J domain-containing protein [Anaerolineae bacterium]|nr:J domain-containing protein [Anaerolineae bacterium]HMR64301.1 J domain-containing protein [Anaerolineae bacterium]
MDYRDYYKVLDIERDTSNEEIEKAYRKLARRFHPDVNPGDRVAEERYRDISEAHRVLTNSAARTKYDALTAKWDFHQSTGLTTDFDWNEWFAGDEIVDGTDLNLETVVGQRRDAGDRSFSDFYYAFFDGVTASQLEEESPQPNPVPVDEGSTEPTESDENKSPAVTNEVGQLEEELRKGEDITQTVEISLQEAFTGTSRILRLGHRKLEVKIPRGAQSGTKIRVRGEGAEGSTGAPKGDLYLEIAITSDPAFERIGDDIHLELPVNVYTAVLGGEVIVPTLRGKIKLRIPPETQSGKVFRIKGQGMPKLQNPEERGDLYCKVMITVPENLTEEEIELFEELADIRGL